jgi:predicted dehydrogenase
MTAYLEDRALEYDPVQSRLRGAGNIIDPTPINTYRAEIEEFSSAILEGRRPLNSLERGIRSQKVTEACYESARSGKAIRII